jgi:anti-anti-sigma regulatory factor
MPRAKQKTAGSKRGRKSETTAVAENSVVAAEFVPAEETAEAEAMPPDDTVAETLPPTEQCRAEPALVLPDCLDSAAAITIKEMLLSQRGNALAVDASQVRRVGVQSLQVLVAAARAWQRDGLSYRLENPSPEFLETIGLVGLPRQDLLLEGHQ